MNCPKCGSLLPQGAPFCGICNEPVSPVGMAAYGQPGYGQQGYAQPYPQAAQGYPPAYGQAPAGQAPVGQAPSPPAGYGQPMPQASAGAPQGYAQTYQQAAQGYPQGYQPAFGQQDPRYPQGFQPITGGYSAPQGQKQPGAFLASVARIPRMLPEALRDPGGVLQDTLERHDLCAPAVVCLLALLLAFLCALSASRGLVLALTGALSPLLGGALASRDGVNSIAGAIGASVGGIAALCQLLAMLLPLAVLLLYLCVIRKARFSFELALGLAMVLTLPTLPFSLLTLLAGLFSPALAGFLILCPMTVSYAFFGSLMARVTGSPEAELTRAKVLLILLALGLTLSLVSLAAGLLSGGLVSSLLGRFGIR